ncbi:MAG: hypothetical protein ACXAD7_04715 [Candidatus Kariarchaeaceae archaeon]|jgi:hypothetical protein
MAINVVNTVLLSFSGVIALVITGFQIKAFLKEKKLYHYYWAVGFFMHSVIVIIIMVFGYDSLDKPLIPFFASFIPIGITIGLYYAIWEDKNYGLYLTLYEFIVLVLLLSSNYEFFLASKSDIFMAIAHIPCGISLIVLPIYAVLSNKASVSCLYCSFAGIVVSLRAFILTSFKLYEPLKEVFDEEVSNSIIPGFLIIVGIFLILGISLPSKWKVDIPILTNHPN